MPLFNFGPITNARETGGSRAEIIATRPPYSEGVLPDDFDTDTRDHWGTPSPLTGEPDRDPPPINPEE